MTTKERKVTVAHRNLIRKRISQLSREIKMKARELEKMMQELEALFDAEKKEVKRIKIAKAKIADEKERLKNTAKRKSS